MCLAQHLPKAEADRAFDGWEAWHKELYRGVQPLGSLIEFWNGTSYVDDGILTVQLEQG